MAHVGKHAVVIGAGMGGLLSARALSDQFDQVTIIERDGLPDQPEPRKGVPQGRQAHALLDRGREIIEQLFPGFADDMNALGVPSGDMVNDGLWYNHGVYLGHAPSTMIGIGLTRPLLEGYVRQRLMQLPNISLGQRHDALELAFDRTQGRVNGILIRARGAKDVETIDTDLVIDSSGRGSLSPGWLGAMGYDKPREEQIRVNQNYVSRFYRRLPEHNDILQGKKFVVMSAAPPSFRGGVLVGQEGERWIVSLGGSFEDKAPTDNAGYLEFARSLPKPEIYNVLKNAEPLTEPTPYTFSGNLRRHYEELSRFPEGYLVFGDALCSFNPIYGQGMTVAALESLALQNCLASGMHSIAKRFFRAASRVIDTPWQVTAGNDLRHPRVEGKRTAQVRFINWYISKYYQAAQRDATLARKFVEVANLIHEPTVLLSPQNALKVWKGNRVAGQRRTEAQGEAGRRSGAEALRDAHREGRPPPTGLALSPPPHLD